jgi:hypothetical protein
MVYRRVALITYIQDGLKRSSIDRTVRSGMLSLPVTQVQISPAPWRRVEIRFVFRDELRKLPRIQQYGPDILNVILVPHIKCERALRSCVPRSQDGESVRLQIPNHAQDKKILYRFFIIIIRSK